MTGRILLKRYKKTIIAWSVDNIRIVIMARSFSWCGQTGEYKVRVKPR